MPLGNGTALRVSHLPAAEVQMRELANRAIERGVLQELARILHRAIRTLQTRPLKWGEPTYHPKKLGSVVRHGGVGGLIFEYVVFEPERVVMILKVTPITGSPWK